MVCPLYRDCPLLRDSNCIILIGWLKFGDLVLSIVERYLIQCPLFGVSVKRDSTVYDRPVIINRMFHVRASYVHSTLKQDYGLGKTNFYDFNEIHINFFFLSQQ